MVEEVPGDDESEELLSSVSSRDESATYPQRRSRFALVAVGTLAICAGAFALKSTLAQDTSGELPLVGSKVGTTVLVEQKELVPGLRLHAVHVQRVESDGRLTHSRHPVQAKQASTKFSRRLQNNETDLASGEQQLQQIVAAVGDLTLEKQHVYLMAALSAAAYGPSDIYSLQTMAPILEAKESLFGPEVTQYEEEKTRWQKINDVLIPELTKLGNASLQEALGIDASHVNSTGVHAYEFKKEGYGTILVYRGSYSEGDFANTLFWLTKWVVKRGDFQLKHQWIDLAGFDWDDKPKPSFVYSAGRVVDTLAYTLGSKRMHKDFIERLEKIAQDQGMSVEDVAKVAQTGYWEFTKKIVDSAYDDWKAGGELDNFYLTGHSQGGARAALSSAYLEKTQSKKIKTTTFAAIGGTCFSREMSTGTGLLDDLDPYIVHDQITDYSHIWDIFGNFDYDLGKQCLYGKTDLKNSRAYKWCKDLFAYELDSLMISTAADLPHHQELTESFERCRYMTHFSFAVIQDLFKPEFLKDDGTTDAGCSSVEINKDDDKNQCPVGESVYNKAGCEAYSTCGTCTSSEHDKFGLNCRWCGKDQKCRPNPLGWLMGCDSTCDA